MSLGRIIRGELVLRMMSLSVEIEELNVIGRARMGIYISKNRT